MLIKATNNQYLSLGVVQGSKNCNGILLIVVTYCTISLQSNNPLTVPLAEKHQLRVHMLVEVFYLEGGVFCDALPIFFRFCHFTYETRSNFSGCIFTYRQLHACQHRATHNRHFASKLLKLNQYIIKNRDTYIHANTHFGKNNTNKLLDLPIQVVFL